MASFRCYDSSDVIATLIMTNFPLYLIQLWWQFFPNACLWRRSLCSNLAGINSEKLYRATFICQYGLFCCEGDNYGDALRDDTETAAREGRNDTSNSNPPPPPTTRQRPNSPLPGIKCCQLPEISARGKKAGWKPTCRLLCLLQSWHNKDNNNNSNKRTSPI